MLSEKIPIECHTKYFITSGRVIQNDENVKIFLSWPQTEKLLLRYVSEQDWIDFIVYIGSCIGFWFGLSILSVMNGLYEIFRE